MALYLPLAAKHFKSDAWRELRASIVARIEQLRTDNDAFDNTEHMTAANRGRIAELKALLALEEAPAEVPRAGDDVRARLQDPVDMMSRRRSDADGM